MRDAWVRIGLLKAFLGLKVIEMCQPEPTHRGLRFARVVY